MGTRLAELVERFGGQLAGDPDLEVTGIAPLDAAGASHVSFLSNSKLRAQAIATRAAALVHAPADEEALAAGYQGARIVVRNPYAWFARAAQYFVSLTEVKPAPGIHPSAVIAPSARVDSSAHIGPHVVVEEGARVGARCVIGAGSFIGRDAVVGEDTQFFANVTFHARCVIGKRGVLHSGAVIGTDGFGFANEGGVYIKIPQTGRVVIGDDVDIGANTTVDRGAMADTTIDDGVKIDNLVQIAHNVQIGAHTAMAGCVGVAGSAKIGKHCMFGGAAMVNGHIEIVDNVYVTAGTLASRSITEPGQYTGFYPFAKNSEWEKGAAIVRNIDAMRDKIRALEKQIKNLVEPK